MGLFNRKKEPRKPIELKCPYCSGIIREMVEDDQERNVIDIDVLGGQMIFAMACKHCKKILGIYGSY